MMCLREDIDKQQMHLIPITKFRHHHIQIIHTQQLLIHIAIRRHHMGLHHPHLMLRLRRPIYHHTRVPTDLIQINKLLKIIFKSLYIDV